MKYLALFILITLSLDLHSKGKEERLDSTTMGFSLRSNQPDSTVPTNVLQYVFNFTYQSKFQGLNTLDYSINNEVFTRTIDTNFQLVLSQFTSENTFQFYLPGYAEITVPYIPTKFGNKVIIDLYFNHQEFHNIICDKPVIYMYPEEKTDVQVEVKPKGTFTFTYPEYKDGWNVTAEPGGNILHDNNSYNYLFWESNQKWIPKASIFNHGSIVDKEDITAFLETKLDEFGLNSKEKADFITFWAPQLMKNNATFIHFMVDDAANEFAELKITPQPDHIYRLYIISYPIDKYDVSLCRPQNLKKIDRSRFTVIEWGGSILDKDMNTYNSEL